MKITEEFIKSTTNPTYFDRGYQYYENGAVFQCIETDQIYIARVSGTKDYSVTIDKNDLECSCTCPAFEMNRTCKHIVAVLLAIMNNCCNNKKRENIDVTKNRLKQTDLTKTVIKNNSVDKIISDIKSLIRSQHRYFQNWDRYFFMQDQIVSKSTSYLYKLPNTIEACKACLELGKWYDLELEKIDDSNGTNQDLLMEILQNAVQISIFNGVDAGIDIFKPYLFYDGSFGFGSSVAEAIFEYPEKTKLAEDLGKFCDKSNEESFAGLYTMWCSYLQNNKDPRFEKIALNYYRNNFEILRLLVKQYFTEKRYVELIKIAWNYRSNYLVEAEILESLRKLNDYDRMIILLKEQLEKRFDKTKFLELQSIFKKANIIHKLDQCIDDLLHQYDKHDLLQILMTLRRYEDVANILIKNINDFTLSVEPYALKLSVLDPKSAIRLYWSLVKNEELKFTTSNYYLKFFSYIDMLTKIGDKNNIVVYLRNISLKYPTKKKLIERTKKIFAKSPDNS